MSVCGYFDLLEHVGHEVVVVQYGDELSGSVCIECEDCNEVLLSFDMSDELDEIHSGNCDHGVSLTRKCKECEKLQPKKKFMY